MVSRTPESLREFVQSLTGRAKILALISGLGLASFIIIPTYGPYVLAAVAVFTILSLVGVCADAHAALTTVAPRPKAKRKKRRAGPFVRMQVRNGCFYLCLQHRSYGGLLACDIVRGNRNGKAEVWVYRAGELHEAIVCRKSRRGRYDQPSFEKSDTVVPTDSNQLDPGWFAEGDEIEFTFEGGDYEFIKLSYVD